MTKISKQTKLEAILEYISGNKSKQEVAKRYGIHYTSFKMLFAAYKTHRADECFNLPMKIENEALKLLASIQQRTDNSQK